MVATRKRRSSTAARVGRKQLKQKGHEAAARLPTVTPSTKCKLRLLKLEPIKDYLLMEGEFMANQERLKPQEEKLRKIDLSVGNLEELIDENQLFLLLLDLSTMLGYFAFVDKDQLEHGCSIFDA